MAGERTEPNLEKEGLSLRDLGQLPMEGVGETNEISSFVSAGLADGLEYDPRFKSRQTARIIIVPLEAVEAKKFGEAKVGVNSAPEKMKDLFVIFQGGKDLKRFVEAGRRKVTGVSPDQLKQRVKDRVVVVGDRKTGKRKAFYVPPKELDRVKFDTGVVPINKQQRQAVKRTAENWVVAQPSFLRRRARLSRLAELKDVGLVDLSGKEKRRLNSALLKTQALLEINRGVEKAGLSLIPRPDDFKIDLSENKGGLEKDDKLGVYERVLKKFQGTKSVGGTTVSSMPAVEETVTRSSDDGENSGSDRLSGGKKTKSRVKTIGGIAAIASLPLTAPILVSTVVENGDQIIDVLEDKVISEEQASKIRRLLDSLVEGRIGCTPSSVAVAEQPEESLAEVPVVEEESVVAEEGEVEAEKMVELTAVVEDNGGGVAPYPTSTEGFALGVGGSQEMLRNEIYKLAGADLEAMENTLIVKLLRQGVLESGSFEEAVIEFNEKFGFEYNVAGTSWNVVVRDKSSNELWIAKDKNGLTFSSLMPLMVDINDFEMEVYRPENEKVGKVIVIPVTSGPSEGHFVVGGYDVSNESVLIEWFDAANDQFVEVTLKSLISADMQAVIDADERLSIEGLELFDGILGKVGNIVDGQLVLSEKFNVEGNGVFIDRKESSESVELDVWDKLALVRLGITPVTFEGVASITDGRNVLLPVPEGAEIVREAVDYRGDIVKLDNETVVRLSNGSLMVSKFAQPDGMEIFYGTDNQTGKAVVVTKAVNGEFGQPRPIEYEDAVAIVTLEFEGNTNWVVIREGEVRPDTTKNYIADVQNLSRSVDLEKLEQKQTEYVTKMNNENGYSFNSWQEMMGYFKEVFANHTIQRGRWEYSGTDVLVKQEMEGTSGNAKRFPNHGVHFEALGLGWETVYNDTLGIDLIRVDFINPYVSDELMSEYVGYVDKNGQLMDFVQVSDRRVDISDESKHNSSYGSENFKEILDYLASGKEISRYQILTFSTSDIDTTPPSELFAIISKAARFDNLKPEPIYDLAMSEPGLYYRLLSDPDLVKLVFLLGLKPDELSMINQGLGGDNTFLGIIGGIKVGTK